MEPDANLEIIRRIGNSVQETVLSVIQRTPYVYEIIPLFKVRTRSWDESEILKNDLHHWEQTVGHGTMPMTISHWRSFRSTASIPAS